MECTFIDCNRVGLKKSGLCRIHRVQQMKGHPLTPIGSSPRGGHNKKEYTTCLFEPCESMSHAKGYCGRHYSQKRRGRLLTMTDEIPDKGFSATKTCAKCGETKTWKLFPIGFDECSECYRAWLLPKSIGEERAGKEERRADLLDFLNRTELE